MFRLGLHVLIYLTLECMDRHAINEHNIYRLVLHVVIRLALTAVAVFK